MRSLLLVELNVDSVSGSDGLWDTIKVRPFNRGISIRGCTSRLSEPPALAVNLGSDKCFEIPKCGV